VELTESPENQHDTALARELPYSSGSERKTAKPAIDGTREYSGVAGDILPHSCVRK
jgi:hypothetical protein